MQSKERVDDQHLTVIKSRHRIYTFLSRMYEKEITEDLLKDLASEKCPILQIEVEDLVEEKIREGFKMLRGYLKRLVKRNLEAATLELAEEYAGLFLGVRVKPSHPSESFYMEGLVMQKSRDEAQHTYWSVNVDKEKTYTEPEDHIAIELQFMAYLCRKTIEALEKKNKSEAKRYLQMQKNFINDLVLWVSKLTNDVLKSAKVDFYKSIAKITNGFISMENKVDLGIEQMEVTNRGFLKTIVIAGKALTVSTIGLEERLLRAITPAEVKELEEESRRIHYHYNTNQMMGDGRVTVKNGRIIRVRPIHFDPEKFHPWTIEAHGKTFSPPPKTSIGYGGGSQRSWVYTSARIRYPLKRVDWDPDGERNPQNRGKSGYVRISWEEAFNIIASEMERVKETYGPSAILFSICSHSQTGSQQYMYSLMQRFFYFYGGTRGFQTTNSWEGMFWGSMNAWGFPSTRGYAPGGSMEDCMRNTDLIIYWSNDPEKNPWRSPFQRDWIKELGKKIISISPDCNYMAGRYADKWIPVIPGGDTALAAAIAHVWITEGTYEKKYVYTHGYGFDKWKEYITGEEDGEPKTPEWAETICGIPARTIRALAREWAAKRTYLVAGGSIGYGGAGRRAYGDQWARMLVLLATMQGLGRPGSNQGRFGVPSNPNRTLGPHYMLGGINWVAWNIPSNPVEQYIVRPLVPDAILNPPLKWHGGFGVGPIIRYAQQSIEENQFMEQEYPLPGCSEFHLIHRWGGSFLGTDPHSIRYVKAYQSPKIECITCQDVMMKNLTRYADIVLPICTVYERNDVMLMADGNHEGVIWKSKAIENMWESKSDMDVFYGLSDKLGFYDEYTEGNSEEDWMKKSYIKAGGEKFMSWEDFKKKGYIYIPFPKENIGKYGKPGFRSYYEKPEGEGLETPSGKIEFFAQSIYKQYGNDPEIPAVPHHIPDWEGRNTHPLVDKYPLQLQQHHPKLRYHTQLSNITILKEIPTVKIKRDDYYYEPCWIHPKDAAERGIKDGDLIRVFNDRAQILTAAFITERIIPGVVNICYGSGYDPEEPGNPESLDKGGESNLLSGSSIDNHYRWISKHAHGLAPNSCLVEVEKWRG